MCKAPRLQTDEKRERMPTNIEGQRGACRSRLIVSLVESCAVRESARLVRTQTPLRYVLRFPVRKIPSVIYRKDADRAAGARQGAAGARWEVPRSRWWSLVCRTARLYRRHV